MTAILASLFTIQTLFGFSLSFALTIIFAIYFVSHPEKLEKLISIMLWVTSRVYQKAEYYAIKFEIQGKLNSFVRNLESNTTLQFPKVSIKWTAQNNSEIVWEDGEAIIVMRDRKHKNKNMVHAAYFFTSEALLKKSGRHLSKNQKISLDLFATKKILESESNAAVEQFMNDYLIPYIEKEDEIRQHIQQCVHIDRIGVFFPILIQELFYLENKVFLSKPTSEVMNEVKKLIDFLEKFAQREVGDTEVPDSFVGKYTRCAIKIVASKEARELGDISSHVKRILTAIEVGYENIYIIGSAENENIYFIDEVSEGVIKGCNHIELIRSYKFDGQIKIRGRLTNVITYLVCLHNSNAVKYLHE